MNRSGMTLLETVVALAILAITATALLQSLSQAVRTVDDLDRWSTAVALAEEGMEAATLDVSGRLDEVSDALPGGFQRRVTRRPVSDRLTALTVMVQFPDGRVFRLDRLVEAGP